MRESIQKHVSRKEHQCRCHGEKSHGMRRAGVPVVIEDDRFNLIKTLYFNVPEDYSNDKPAFRFFMSKMADGYKPTASFKAGRIVKLDLYQLHDGPTLQDCLEFIKRQNGLFVGPEGLLLSWLEKEADLPEEHWLLSLDKEETLLRDDHGHPRLPSVFKSWVPIIKSEPYQVRLDGPLSGKNCLMVFTYEGDI